MEQFDPAPLILALKLCLVLIVANFFAAIVRALVTPNLPEKVRCDVHDWAWTESAPGKISVLKCKRFSCGQIAGPVDEWNRPNKGN